MEQTEEGTVSEWNGMSERRGARLLVGGIMIMHFTMGRRKLRQGDREKEC